MKTLCWTLWIPLALGGLLFSFQVQGQGGPEGQWLGSLEIGGTELRIVFKIKSDDGGVYSANLDSPDQGAIDLEFTEVSVDGSAIKLEIKPIAGKYVGTLTTTAIRSAVRGPKGDSNCRLH